MGCIYTKPSMAKVAPSVDPLEQFFIDLISKREYPLGDEVPEGELSPLLTQIKSMLNLSIKKPEDREIAAVYLNKVIDNSEKFLLFDTLIEIMARSHHTWLLNNQSLRFFHDLKNKNQTIFNDFIDSLQKLAERNGINLEAEHIDAVVDAFIKQMKLPAKIPAILEAFAEEKQRSFNATIQSLRATHGPKIDIAADRLSLIHHASPHALEIRVRTMHVMQHLQLFNTDSHRDNFLRSIIAFMVEFHDYIQRPEKGKYPSAEIATAETIISWLKLRLNLNRRPDMISILEYMASQIIILGTTIVFGRTCTDLSKIYFMLEQYAFGAGFPDVNPNNVEFKKSINAVMLITGINDKMPSALGPVAMLQSRPETDTLNIIRQHKPDQTLVLEEFFEDGLSPYVDGASTPTSLDRHRFLIGVTPHIAMRAELSKQNKLVDVLAFIKFIRECRIELLEKELNVFNAWFAEQFEIRQMVRVVNNLFFSALDGEVTFCRGQAEGVIFARDKLRTLVTQTDISVLDVEAVENEARNIAAFKLFIDRLETRVEAKKALVSELILVVVRQAGTCYAADPSLSYISSGFTRPKGFLLLPSLSLKGLSNKRSSLGSTPSDGRPTPLSSTSTALTVTPFTPTPLIDKTITNTTFSLGMFNHRQVTAPEYVSKGSAAGVHPQLQRPS